MSGNRFKEHAHFGRPHRNFLDPKKALREIGLKKRNILLDVACGEGRFSIPAARIVGENGMVYAIDISEEAINTLKGEMDKQGFRNIKAFTGDITKRLPVDDESIDVCLLANILHGLVVNKKAESTLKEIFRALKPDGTLGVVDFKYIGGPPGPPLSIRMSPEEVEKIITKYGFEKVKTAEVGKYHYAITFAKKVK